jgi:uncharacterized protein
MEEPPFWTWTDLLLFAGLGVPVFIVVFTAAQFVMMPLRPNRAALYMVPQFLAQFAMLVPMALLVRWKYEQRLLTGLRLGIRKLDIAPSFGVGVLLAIAVLLLAAVLHVPDVDSPMKELMNDPASARWIAVFAVSIGPAFEEIFFRGLLQPVAARTFGAIIGVLIVAVPFALLHGKQYAWSWPHILLIAVVGAAFGWWRIRMQSTGAAIVMHSGYNAVLIVGYLIGKSSL